MDLKTLGAGAKQVLATVAPFIGTAIGGPFGTAAGALLSNLLGTPKGDSSTAETALLSATPELLEKLKEANLAFKAQMAQLGITEEQLQLADVQSARNMQIANKSWTPTILSYGVLGAGIIAFLGVIFGFVHIPTDNATAAIVGSALTYLLTESKSILGYWFGTTMDSGRKTEVLAQMAQGDS